MRNKKLLSTVVASALVATTMAMPVMAEEGGNFDVNVTTKTGVIRVQVPTSMAMAVDQFELTHTGNQIAAGEFDMQNFSEMDVKVAVTSVATLGTDISLVPTAQAVGSSTGNEAWLAVAAKTNDGTANSNKCYDDAGTAAKTEEFWELTDGNANVTSFASDTKKAEQIFYLAKGTGSAVYKLAVPSVTTGTDKYEKKTYAKYYKLTALGTQPTDDATLQTAVNDNDVYVVVTANNGKNEEVVTKLEKGSTVATGAWTNSNTYYTAADDASNPTGSDIYVYGAMATGGSSAGFTYIGKLSDARESWTNADINKVNVAYTIVGIKGTRYNEVSRDCTYGLYKEPSYVSTNTLTASSNSLTLSLPTGVTLSKVELTYADGTGAITLSDGEQYTLSGTTLAVPADNIMAWLGLSPAYNKLVLTFSDAESETIVIQ